MKIAEMNASERPRERLLAQGPGSLKTEELLAILFGTGRRGCDEVQMSRELLSKYGGLKSLSRAHASELAPKKNGAAAQDSVKGIGEAKAISLLAALELGRRAALEEDRPDDPRTRLEFWTRRLQGDDREFIVALYLDEKEKLIADERLSYGGADGAELDAPYLMRRAVRLSCRSLVLLHNHPCGGTAPSQDDMRLSRAVGAMLKVLQIGFYGHYIVGDGEIRRIQGDGSMGADIMLNRASN